MAIKFLNTVAVDTDVLYVDASNDRVGIGTTSPSGSLHVQNGASGQTAPNNVANGLVIETSSSTGAGMSILSPSSTSGNIFFGDESDNYVGGFRYYHNINEMTINVNNAEALRIDSSRNVGIGTTNPNAKLQVNDNVRIGSTSTGVRFYIQGVDEFRADAIDVGGSAWNSLHFRADGTDGLFLQ